MKLSRTAQVAARALVVMLVGLTFPGQSGRATMKDDLSGKALDMVGQSPEELQQTLAPYLLAWGARDEGEATWASLPFAEGSVEGQARMVTAIIEANHAAQDGQAAKPSLDVLGVLQAAATITDPYRIFHEPSEPAHPLLADIGARKLYHELQKTYPDTVLANALKAAMRAVWRDYTGRKDLSGMVGEEAPGPVVQWLFAETTARRAKAEVPELDKLCPAAFRPVWACQSSAEGRVETLCLGEGAGRRVQFRTIMPGEAPSWTLPDNPAPATEVMEFWVNDTTLITKLSDGPQSLTIMQGEGPMGTNGRIAPEVNMNPGRPRDCNIISDTIAHEFSDLIPCDDRFDAASCPFSYILPFSDRRAIKLHELRGFSADQLMLAQAELFARHGPKLHTEPEKAHFGARAWFKAAEENVSVDVLSEVERQNIHFIQNQRNRPRLDDSAQWALPASGAHWRGEITFADGRKGSLSGSDYRVQFTPDSSVSGGRAWLYLPREAEVYMYRAGDDEGVIEPDWRTPWLLPTDVLNALDVKVVNEREARIAGEEARCFTLSGKQKDFGGVGGDDLWLSGDICLTMDGVPVKMDMKGGHELEGQGDVMPWEHAYEMTRLRRAIQPETIFTPPEGKQWNRPG